MPDKPDSFDASPPSVPPVEQNGSSACGNDPSRPKRRRNHDTRKDKNHFHAMRHAILTQFPLQALVRLGESARGLRRMERELRAELKPTGIVGDMLFDRMFSSYLRCILAARREGLAVLASENAEDPPGQVPKLVEGELPVMIWGSPERANVTVPAGVFRQLLLVQRYDAHFSKEMFRCFGLLLLLRNGGEAGLEQAIAKMLGFPREP